MRRWGWESPRKHVCMYLTSVSQDSEVRPPARPTFCSYALDKDV